MTGQERIQALTELGYLPREAEFLCLAALHSGHFLRRHYRRFLGAPPGFQEQCLVARLLENRHASILDLNSKAQILHLDSHPFYRRIGYGDNRHRRRRSPKAVKLKLMGLDFVLDHRSQRFLPTEADKLDFFCEGLGISKELLPRRNYRSSSAAEPSVRHFVDKSPIFVEGKRVSFCYLDGGSISCKGFETHLGQYLGLLSALGDVRFYYAALSNRLFPWAKRSFRRTLRLDCPLPPGRLAEFFRLERLYRERRFDRLDQARLIRLRKFRQEFQRPGIEFLYRRWLDLGAKESSLGFDPCSQIRCEFTSYRLEHCNGLPQA